MYLSIVVPCYNEEQVINFTHRELKRELSEYEHEIIYVDDGSSDKTAEIIKRIATDDPCVKYISFSRNFGKESAMLAGLEYATGKYAVIMDADLQHPPELIHEMILYAGQGYDQVIAQRNRTGDKAVLTFFAKAYYKIVNKLTDVELIDGIGDFRLLSRKAVNAVVSMNEYNRFSKGLFSWIGFKQKIIKYDNKQRVAGQTKWSFKSLFRYGTDGILSFNDKPLRFCLGFGALSMVASFLYLVMLLLGIAFKGIDVPGYFTTIFMISFFGGIQLISIGVIGEYVGRIYYEVKHRPHYLINESNVKGTEYTPNDTIDM